MGFLKLAPAVGFEPTTSILTGSRATIAPRRNVKLQGNYSFKFGFWQLFQIILEFLSS